MCAQLSRDVVVVRVARFDQQLVLFVLDLEYGGTDQSPAVILHEHRPWKPALKQLALAWRQSWVIQHHPTILSSADAHMCVRRHSRTGRSERRRVGHHPIRSPAGVDTSGSALRYLCRQHVKKVRENIRLGQHCLDTFRARINWIDACAPSR